MNYLPDDELLSAYLDGEVTSDERVAVEARLADDPAWRAALAELREVQVEVQSLPPQKLPPMFAQSVLSRLPAIMDARPPQVTEHAANDHRAGAVCIFENRADGNGAAHNLPCNAANLVAAPATATSSPVLGVISGLPLAATELASSADIPPPLPARRGPMGFQWQRIAAAVAVLAAGVLVMLTGGPAREGSRPAARNVAVAIADREALFTVGDAKNQTALEKQTPHAQEALVGGGFSPKDSAGFGAPLGGGLGTASEGPSDGARGAPAKSGLELPTPAYPAGFGAADATAVSAPAGHSMKAISAPAPPSQPPSPRDLDGAGAQRSGAPPASPQPQAQAVSPLHENSVRQPARGLLAEGTGAPPANEAADRLRKWGAESLAVVELAISQSAWEQGELLGILEQHSIAWEPAVDALKKSNDAAVFQNRFSETERPAESQLQLDSIHRTHGPSQVKLVVLDAPTASLNRLLDDLQARAGDGKALLGYLSVDAVTERERLAMTPRFLGRRKAPLDAQQKVQGVEAKLERQEKAPSRAESVSTELAGRGAHSDAGARDKDSAPEGSPADAAPGLHAGFAYRLRTTLNEESTAADNRGSGPPPRHSDRTGNSASPAQQPGGAPNAGSNLQHPMTRAGNEKRDSNDRSQVLLLIRVVPDAAPAADPTASEPAEPVPAASHPAKR